MAVNIDNVYQKVLVIANKEQRGYITPLEFNLLANQAQQDIFEQYFYDLNAFMRIPGNDSTYADQVDLLKEKIDIFENYRVGVTMSATAEEAGLGTLPNYYRLGELYYKHRGGYVEIEKINQNDIHHIQNSPLTAPSEARPVYVRVPQTTPTGQTGTTLNGIPRNTTVQIYPQTITSNVYCNYIAYPSTVSWGYTLVDEQALYNANTTQHFELHPSEETELVIKILQLAGILIKDPNLYQMASQENQINSQQEKQ
jgi:hypothetical protein